MSANNLNLWGHKSQFLMIAKGLRLSLSSAVYILLSFEGLENCSLKLSVNGDISNV